MNPDLMDFLHRSQTHASADDFGLDMLRVVRTRVESDVLFFHHVAGSFPPRDSLNADPEILESIRHRWPIYSAELFPTLHTARRTGGIAVDRDVLGGEARRGKRYFRELVLPHDGTDSMFLVLELGPGLVGLLVLGRKRKTFTRAERDELSAWRMPLSLATAAVLGTHVSAEAQSLLGPFASTTDFALTETERDLVGYLKLGLSNREIALARGTSPNTVRNQIHRLFSKLDVANRTELVGRLASH